MALVTFSRDAGEVDTALQYAEQLVVMFPEDRGLIGSSKSFENKRQSGMHNSRERSAGSIVSTPDQF